MTAPTVLDIGASRGLGLALAAEHLRRGAHVVATVRGPARTAQHDLPGEHLEIEHVDITDPEQVAALRRRLDGRTFEQLFVNAGVTNGEHETPADIATDEFVRVMVTNALSPLRVVDTLGDLVTADGTIAIMSSGQGSITNNTHGGFEVYRASKSALNQLVHSYAARYRAHRRGEHPEPGQHRRGAARHTRAAAPGLPGPHRRLVMSRGCLVVSVRCSVLTEHRTPSTMEPWLGRSGRTGAPPSWTRCVPRESAPLH